MLSERFARDLVELGCLDSSPEALLGGIAALAARSAPDCAGAGVLVWREDGVVSSAASHPELGTLLDLQTALGEGPHWAARRTGEAVVVTDFVTDDRWPRLAPAALSSGVRSCLTLPVSAGTVTVTVGLEAVRPGAFGDLGAQALPVLLTEQISVTARRMERHEAAVREVRQMRRALDSRDLIGQAKGVLMQAHGVGADAAFELLRKNAQRSQRKLADVARQVIADYAAKRRSFPPVRDRSRG